ncbi:hypothetical protein A3715_18805 [Oleiphilus sp. HI0009]|nr:hypothetical protein A3715_19250 [Oleiphilus sp. HI0009]KZX81844.1 hypothetical protein A3715_18805 [Oleiphilus sp. HI0009]
MKKIIGSSLNLIGFLILLIAGLSIFFNHYEIALFLAGINSGVLLDMLTLGAAAIGGMLAISSILPLLNAIGIINSYNRKGIN